MLCAWEERSSVVKSTEQQQADDVLRHGSLGHLCGSSTLETSVVSSQTSQTFIEITRDRHHRNIMWPKPPKRLIAAARLSCRLPLTTSPIAPDLL